MNLMKWLISLQGNELIQEIDFQLRKEGELECLY